MTAESVKLFADISRKKGIDAWFTDPITDLIPAGTKCTCGNDTFVKEFDILDVWFDSGVSHFAVLDTWKDHRWPADLYLEGSDQHRGWFQSSFWPAMVLRGRAPYNTVLTHGFMLDEDGKAMSKSLGNVKPPEDIIKEYGADIVRLWVSSEEYRNDVRIGMNMMKQIADSYRRIRNTFKFIIGNLSDFLGKGRGRLRRALGPGPVAPAQALRPLRADHRALRKVRVPPGVPENTQLLRRGALVHLFRHFQGHPLRRAAGLQKAPGDPDGPVRAPELARAAYGADPRLHHGRDLAVHRQKGIDPHGPVLRAR